MEEKFDYLFFLLIVLLMCFGVVMVYSVSSVYAQQKFGDPSYFMKRQMIFVLAAFFIFALLCFIPINFIKKMTLPALIFSVFTLTLVFIPGIGMEVKGAHRWIRLPFVNIQPSEFAKVALVIYIAHFTSRKGELIRDFKRGFLPPVLVMLIISFLIVQEPDFGNAAVIVLLGLTTLFIAGAKTAHLFGFLLSVGIPTGVYLIFSEPYRLRRILSFIDPWKFRHSGGFQTIQSYLALGSGGLTGVGLGNSMQKLFYLPEAHTDFVLSVVGEELGFIGLFTIFGAIAYICIKGFKIAIDAPDNYHKALAGGLASLIFIQSFLNAGVTLGVLPPKGMPFPFISYGGSFLMVCAIACGLILNVGRYSTGGKTIL